MSTNATMKSNTKKYCRICYDAGFGEYTYRSHNVKEKRGNTYVVTCKTLLNTTCNTCLKKGHTSKYCRSQYTSRHTNYNNSMSKEQCSVKTIKNTNQKSPNTFASLNDDCDNDEGAVSKSSTNENKIPIKTPVVKKRWSEMTDSDDDDD